MTRYSGLAGIYARPVSSPTCCACATMLMPRDVCLTGADATNFVKATIKPLTLFVALPMCDTKSQKSLLPNKRVLLGCCLPITNVLAAVVIHIPHDGVQ
jgi:hypothetical protein